MWVTLKIHDATFIAFRQWFSYEKAEIYEGESEIWNKITYSSGMTWRFEFSTLSKLLVNVKT